MNEPNKAPLLILGVYPESDGYPNIKYRLDDLKAANCFDISVLHATIWPHNIPSERKTSLIPKTWQFLWAHAKILYAYLRHPHKQLVYVPYPAIFIALILSWLPPRHQPKRLVLDAFISLYDTLVIDRKFFAVKNPIARLLYAIERRAFQKCSVVVVDTEQNARYFGHLFQLPRQHFTAIPLSTDEAALYAAPYVFPPFKTVFTVLFIGTLIPLHGLDVILGAIKLLASKQNIHFKIIGSGQMSPLMTAFIAENDVNLTWIKEWYSSENMLQVVAAADICLGVFGNTAKTQRVCPLKLYLYTACGRATISADSPCLRSFLENTATPAINLVPADHLLH